MANYSGFGGGVSGVGGMGGSNPPGLGGGSSGGGAFSGGGGFGTNVGNISSAGAAAGVGGLGATTNLGSGIGTGGGVGALLGPGGIGNAAAADANAGVTSNPALGAAYQAGVAAAVGQQVANQQLLSNGRVFTQFDAVNDIVEAQKKTVTRGLWTGDKGELLTFFTSSTENDTQFKYYVDVQNSASLGNGGATQFAVAYGHRKGSGSFSSGQLEDSTTKAIYSQYRNLLLDPSDSQFTFKTGDSTTRNSDDIYIVNIQRARLRDKLDPGNWELNLSQITGSNTGGSGTTGGTTNAKSIGTGSFVNSGICQTVISLIDDSGDSGQTVTTAGGLSSAVYNVVSGSISNGIYKDAAGEPQYYGLVYPDTGYVILDPSTLNTSCSFNTVTASAVEGYNAFKLFNSISASAIVDTSKGFQARNSEVITSANYFVRVKNGEYNFSNNPTFATQSTGEINQKTFIGDPKVYLTTVGLYNDTQELLAVGKLSKATIKSFDREALIRVKLDF